MTSNYADDILINISDDGMTDDLWQLVYDDNDKLSSLKLQYRRCFVCKRTFCANCSEKYFRYPKDKQNVCEECWEKNKDKRWVKKENDDLFIL